MSDSLHLDARPLSPASAGAAQGGRAADKPPTLAEARKRLASRKGRKQPWLAPEALEAARDLPEVSGPEHYVPPCPSRRE